MSAAMLPRIVLRQSRWAMQRRAASSSTEAASEAVSSRASQAKEGVKETAGKAQEGLSRVTSSAGSMVGGATNAVGSAVSSIGGRTGALINYAQGLIPPTIYYAKVAGELGRIVVQGRSMQPPTMQAIQTYLTPVTNALRNPQSLMSGAQGTAQSAANNPRTYLQRLRSMETETLMTTGIVTAETIGFFCIGEMIGRFKIVGYRGGKNEHH